MKLKFNYRSRRFTPKLRVALAEPRNENMQRLREALAAEFASLQDTRGHLVRLTLNEAEAMAFQTAFPQLVFPLLAKEKLAALAAWHERQAELRPSGPVLAFAE